jgi:hypothetical protein
VGKDKLYTFITLVAGAYPLQIAGKMLGLLFGLGAVGAVAGLAGVKITLAAYGSYNTAIVATCDCYGGLSGLVCLSADRLQHNGLEVMASWRLSGFRSLVYPLESSLLSDLNLSKTGARSNLKARYFRRCFSRLNGRMS